MNHLICPECGNHHTEQGHKLSCDSRELVGSYVYVLDNLQKLSQCQIDKLQVSCYVESVERRHQALDELCELSQSLGLYNIE